MKSNRSYILIVSLLLAILSCNGLSSEATPTPENISPENNTSQSAPTNTPPAPVASLSAESVWIFDGGEDPFEGPFAITMDGQGNLYVADTNHFRIVKINSDGQLLNQWGRDGESQGQFWTPNGVAIDAAGNVYVADGGVNNRIQVFTSEGQFITLWGTRGSAEGQFEMPNDIEIDEQGNVFVIDYKNFRIQKFDTSGNFLAAWGSQGEQDGQFGTLTNIAIDQQGNVYASDDYYRRITKFDNNGQFLLKWENLTCKFSQTGAVPDALESPAGMWLDAQGHLYVVDSKWNRICVYDENGAFLGGWGEEGAEEGQLNFPTDLVGDNTGDIYVIEYSNNRVQKFRIK